MFEISKLKVERENYAELMSGFVFEMQRDYPNDKNFTEYTFRYLNDNGFTKEDLALLQRKFNPHKMYVYVSNEKMIRHLLLVGLVYPKDGLPEFAKYTSITKLSGPFHPIEPEISTADKDDTLTGFQKLKEQFSDEEDATDWTKENTPNYKKDKNGKMVR